MKKTDIAMIILISSISVISSFYISKMIFSEASTGSAKVKTIDKIEVTIKDPSSDIFNKKAINPAVPIQITEDQSKSDISKGQ